MSAKRYVVILPDIKTFIIFSEGFQTNKKNYKTVIKVINLGKNLTQIILKTQCV